MVTTIGGNFYLVKTKDKLDTPVIGGQKNIYGGVKKMVKGYSSWKKFDEYGEYYIS